MSDCYLTCMGSLGALCGLLGMKMTSFRVAGNPGENDEQSPMTRWYWTQQLTVEWTAVGAPMMLWLLLRRMRDLDG